MQIDVIDLFHLPFSKTLMPRVNFDLWKLFRQLEQRLQTQRALRLVVGEGPGFHSVVPHPQRVWLASPSRSLGPSGVRTRNAVLPGEWPGTCSAQSEPSPNTSSTPLKRPVESGAKGHSRSGPRPARNRSVVPCEKAFMN